METEKVYYKVCADSGNFPVARLYFTTKDDSGTINRWAGSIDIRFIDGPKTNISKMKELEKTPGFLFWNSSIEGEEFYKVESIING